MYITVSAHAHATVCFIKLAQINTRHSPTSHIQGFCHLLAREGTVSFMSGWLRAAGKANDAQEVLKLKVSSGISGDGVLAIGNLLPARG